MATNPPVTDARVISATTDRLFETVEGLFGRPLTAPERLSFTTRLAGISTAAVAPGDLITADLFNAMRADINDLALRLAALEGAGAAPVLVRVEPGGIDIPVASLVTLIGSGLRPDFADTQVLMDNVVVLDNATMSAFNVESDDTRLIFAVPNRFTGLPRPVSIRVRSNGATSNALTVRIAPEAIFQSGTVDVLTPTDAIGTIIAGRAEPYILNWTVISRTRLPATYSFNPVLRDVTGASEAAWTAGITLSETGPIELQPFAPRVIRMSVRVPAAAVSAKLSLRAATASNTIERTGSAVDFIAGSAPEVSDPRVRVALRPVPMLFQGAPNPLAAVSGGGLAMRPGASSVVPVEFSFPTSDASAAGEFRYRARVEGQTARWTLGAPTPTGQTAAVGNAPQWTVPITSASSGGANVDTTTVSFLVIYAERFAGGAVTPNLTSFIRIPITGRV
jgi:hypothetical protein